jgi:hypothetical protein
MSHSLTIALVISLLVALTGCRTIGRTLEGQNSDRNRGSGYCPVPERDAEGNLQVHQRDWSAGPERIW